MSRKETPTPTANTSTLNALVVQQGSDALNQLALVDTQLQERAQALAHKLGYDGALTVGALEDEIRFYQNHTIAAMLEMGKRLLILKDLTPHGEFEGRVELLGFAHRTAQRFMGAAKKTSKSATVALLASQVKDRKAFLELITHDDDVIDNLAELDNFDRMSASELRAAARDMQAEAQANEKLLADKSAKIDKLSRHMKKATPDSILLELQKEATALMNDALGCVRGQLRGACLALKQHAELNESGDQSLFMAGLLGQVQADLAALRHEFDLPDLSNAADAQAAAEVAQWAK